MTKTNITLACLPFASLLAVCEAQQPEESGSVRSAYTFHILVAREAQASRLYKELEKVKPDTRLVKFKEVAKRSSTDPSSKPRGGDLDWVYEGEMVRSFEDKIFAAKPNEVVAPFKSEFGWHIAYVSEFRETPVVNICRPQLLDAHQKADGQWKEGIALAMQPMNPTATIDQVRQLIGIDWVGPMSDYRGGFSFIRSREGSEDDLRDVSHHVELPLGKLEVTARPKGCAYSVRLEWSVHCGNRQAAFLSATSFEGRGAVGRRLTTNFIGQSRAEYKPIQAGSFAEQLHRISCTEPRR